MVDLTIFPLPFNGFALVADTPEGDAWLGEREADFVPDDPCMAGLPDTALGFEPYRMAELAEAVNRGEISVSRA